MNKIKIEVPEACYAILPSDYVAKVKTKLSPIMVDGFSNSYRQTNWVWNVTGEQAEKAIDEMNEKLGVSKAEAEAMLQCSLFNSWKRYNEILKFNQEESK